MKKILACVLTLMLTPGASAQVFNIFVRSSGGTMTGPLLLPDGTAAAPSLAFSSDADGSGTGLYRSAGNTIAFSVNGTDQWRVNPSAFFPAIDNTDNIGAVSNRIQHLYTGRIVTGAATPTVSGTGYGASGSVAVSAGSSDLCGSVTISVAGAGPATSGTVVLTFSSTNGAYGSNDPSVVAMLGNSSGTWNARASLIRTASSTTAVTLTWDNNGVALTAGQNYVIYYHVIGK